MTKKDLAKEFISLIERYGENDELETFEYSDYATLAHSTIDKIVKIGDDNVMFYYNENTNDCDTIGAFKSSDLKVFLKELSAKLSENNA